MVGTFWRPPTGVKVTRVSSPLSLCFIKKAREGLLSLVLPESLFIDASLSETQLFDRLSFTSRLEVECCECWPENIHFEN